MNLFGLYIESEPRLQYTLENHGKEYLYSRDLLFFDMVENVYFEFGSKQLERAYDISDWQCTKPIFSEMNSGFQLEYQNRIYPDLYHKFECTEADAKGFRCVYTIAENIINYKFEFVDLDYLFNLKT